MKCNESFCIIGGDLRQKYLSEILIQNGYSVKTFEVYETDNSADLANTIIKSTAIILPIPFTKNNKNIYSVKPLVPINISDVLNYAEPDTCIYGGCFTESFKNSCQQRGFATFDFLDDDTFELQNSIATAEGSITEAIISSDINLHKSKCLILGYGKCATSIARCLKGFNTCITICARNHLQQSMAYNEGFDFINFHQLKDSIHEYNFIFNTVPSLVLTAEILEHVNKKTTIIDIASKPGGTDFETCKRLKINAKLCLGLPGIYSPCTSAHIIYKSLKDN